jgi:hypothetical protein
MKYLGINLTKETKDLFNENYKPLSREIKEDIRRWKELPCSWIGRINVKVVIQLKAIYMFTAISIKIPMTFCTEIEKKTVVKYIWKHKRTQIAKTILSKMSNARGTTISDIKPYYRAITIITTLYWHKNRQKEQRIRTEDPDINPHIDS